MKYSNTETTASEDAGTQTASPASWYALSVLFIAYTFSFIDRTIVSLLVEPLKADLNLSDTEVSLLHGFAFAIFYTLLGIPIARLADNYSRKRIIAIGVAAWSLATCLCGLAGRFWHLFLARVGVGVGEAALSPAAYSMICDLFPRQMLGRALGIYSMGVYIGAGLAFLIGGYLIGIAFTADTVQLPLVGSLKPWQLVFIVVGAPGLLVAVLVMTLREPKRLGGGPAAGLPLAAVFSLVKRERGTFLNHFMGFAALGLLFNAFLAWAPSLLIRQMGYTTAEAGLQIGIAIMVFGSLGIVAGGWHTDRLTRRQVPDAPIRTGLLAGCWLLPVGIAMPLVATPGLKAILLALFFFWSAFPYAAAAAAMQMAAPPQLRAQASALYLFCLNFIGIGMGATLVALLTDGVFGDESALPYSMAITCLISAPLGIYFLFACKTPFRASLAARQREMPKGALL
ncbi:MFS transporter [Exilibacterium tricleocarpae]|uniref:MFS transporter n=1 Tax=Exilibacterium tricleocarpae TaxID=2591008 RepID=A0A545U9P1_9GAMM|nr:MFS transporter [Exilibacterium tricleocarpae]TQV86196.1 MFS transporter [Exilibacterium tricleocarpae]